MLARFWGLNVAEWTVLGTLVGIAGLLLLILGKPFQWVANRRAARRAQGDAVARSERERRDREDEKRRAAAEQAARELLALISKARIGYTSSEALDVWWATYGAWNAGFKVQVESITEAEFRDCVIRFDLLLRWACLTREQDPPPPPPYLVLLKLNVAIESMRTALGKYVRGELIGPCDMPAHGFTRNYIFDETPGRTMSYFSELKGL
jgi:hypothetical protein